MFRMRFAKSLPVCLILVASALVLEGTSANGQVQPNIEAGFKSYGSYDSSKIDTVNLSNGGLTIHIPLPLSYMQRGKINPSYFLVSNSKSWQVQSWTNSGTGQVFYFWNYGPAPGGAFLAGMDPPRLGPYVTNTLPFHLQRYYYFHSDQNGNVDEYAINYSMRDWDDSTHVWAVGEAGPPFASFQPRLPHPSRFSKSLP